MPSAFVDLPLQGGVGGSAVHPSASGAYAESKPLKESIPTNLTITLRKSLAPGAGTEPPGSEAGAGSSAAGPGLSPRDLDSCTPSTTIAPTDPSGVTYVSTVPRPNPTLSQTHTHDRTSSATSKSTFTFRRFSSPRDGARSSSLTPMVPSLTLSKSASPTKVHAAGPPQIATATLTSSAPPPPISNEPAPLGG